MFEAIQGLDQVLAVKGPLLMVCKELVHLALDRTNSISEFDEFKYELLVNFGSQESI